MGTRRSSQDDAANDPTVHITASVQVEVYTDEHVAADGDRPFLTLRLPADYATLTRTFLFIRRPGIPAQTYPVSSVRSFRVDIRPRPPDYDELRQRYPNAYEPWDVSDVAGLQHMHRRGDGIEEIASRIGRPPGHVREKVAAPETPAVIDGPVRREAALLHRAPPEHRVEGAYFVLIQQGVEPLDVAARHGVDPRYIFRTIFNGFAADLTDAQVGALRLDTEVDFLEENASTELD